jgi:multicomponent Na+:H+ antiporter subunit B
MKNNQTGMTLIVKTVTRLTVGLILLYGIYVALQGHIGPGGGFAGGVIIALSFIHLMLAYGKEAVLKKLNKAKCIFLSGFSALVFLLLILRGFIATYAFDIKEGHFKIFSAGLIPFCDIVVSVLVSAGLFVIFLALALLSEPEG